MSESVQIGQLHYRRGQMLLIAGPCVIESQRLCLHIAEQLKRIAERLKLPAVFKASFDKANRTSIGSFRGPGLRRGLQTLQKIRQATGLAVLTDVHEPAQAPLAAEVVDCLQVPAFLCRQTDLLLACGRTTKAVNIKKGQFAAPEDMRYAIEKVRSTGNDNVLLTERGTFFGYHQLVADMRSIPIMQQLGPPVIFDATHSVQRPAAGGVSGGDREMVPVLARAAIAAGADGLFLEVHPEPEKSLSDAASILPLSELEPLLSRCLEIFRTVRAE